MGILGSEYAYVKLARGYYCFHVAGWRKEYVMGIICGSVGVSGIGGIGGIKVCVFIRWSIDVWCGLLGGCVGIIDVGACSMSSLSCI